MRPIRHNPVGRPISPLKMAAAMLALMLMLAGCWPFPPDTPATPTRGPQASGTGTATITDSEGTPVASETETTALPLSTDALNIAGGTEDPPTLDPAIATDNYSLFIIRQLFSGLVTFDDDLNIVPDIAATLPSVSPDGKTYTFVLRKGVRFPDGQEVTSGDFKYSMERAADPRLAGSQPPSALPAGLFLNDIVGVSDKLEGKANEVAGITTPDPYTLVITIDAPKSYFLAKLTSGPSFVVQRSNVEKGADWTENPRGTGPFRLERWDRNQQMVLVSNAEYYGGPPRLSRVNIWMGANATGGLQQYEQEGNTLDVADVPISAIERVTDRNNPMSKELQAVPDLSVTYLGFNVRQKPFDDPKIREALAKVIDRQKIARVMFESRVRQAQGFVPPDMADYKAANVEQAYDVTRARQLITESTYKDARNLPRLRLYTAGGGLAPMLMEVFSQTLGLDVEVHEVEWSDYIQGLDRGEYPMYLLTWAADFPDPEAILGSLFRSGSPANEMGYRNEDVDSALNSAAVETDPDRRMSMYAQVEARVLVDAPAVPLYHSISYTLVKPYVQGLKVTPMGILSLKNVRMLRR